MEILSSRYGYTNYKPFDRPNVGTAKKKGKVVVLMLKSVDVALNYLNIQKDGGSPYVVRLVACYPLYQDELPKLGRNIVNRLDSLDELALIEMQYIEGNMLSDYYNPKGRSFSPEKTYEISSKLMEGLYAIHKAGYYHSDTAKCYNIVLSDDGPIIIDVEAGEIKNKNHIINDNIDIATCLLQLILGDVSYEIDEYGKDIMPPSNKFLNYFKDIRNEFSEYDKTLDILEDIFSGNIYIPYIKNLE